jgi:hypothetical protein
VNAAAIRISLLLAAVDGAPVHHATAQTSQIDSLIYANADFLGLQPGERFE